MPLPRSSVEGESELSESFRDSGGREKPSANRRQAMAVAIAFAFGAVVMLGWLMSDRGEEAAEGSTPAGASETRSAGDAPSVSAAGSGGIPTDAATVEVAGLKGKSASRILAKATSSKIEAALSDGKGWAGGALEVEAQSFSRVVVGKVDRRKGETAPSENEAECFVEASLKVKNAGSGDVPFYDVDFVLVDSERGLVSSSKGDAGLDEGITLKGGEETTVKLRFKVSKHLQEAKFFFGTSDSSGMVFYEVSEPVTLR